MYEFSLICLPFLLTNAFIWRETKQSTMASLEKLVFPIQNAGLLFTEHALHSPDVDTKN